MASGAGAFYKLNGSCNSYTCDLCGKAICEFVEESKYHVFSFPSSNFCQIEGHDSATYITTPAIRVCPKCWEKYQKEFNSFVGVWIETTKRDNAEQIKKHTEELKRHEIIQRERQIRELKNEIKKLKLEKQIENYKSGVSVTPKWIGIEGER